jgi:hypothetical protein
LRQQERTYFENERAHVTFRRVIVDGKTYLLDEIEAVRMVVEPPDMVRPGLIVAGGVVLVIAAVLAGTGTFPSVLMGIGVVTAGAGTLIMLLSKGQYAVAIQGADGVVEALRSRDKDEVSPVVDAIGAVLIVRGR